MIVSVAFVMPVYAESTSLSIEITGNYPADLDKNEKTTRMIIIIQNYDSKDGKYFIKVTNPAGTTVTNSEITPQYWKNGIWKTPVAFTGNGNRNR